MIGIDSIVRCLSKAGFEPHYEGEPEMEIVGYSSLSNPVPCTIVYVENASRLDGIDKNLFYRVVFLVPSNKPVIVASNCGVIKCNNPRFAFYSVVETFFEKNKKENMIAKSAIIETMRIGNNLSVGEFSYISKKVSIGNNVKIGNNVIILDGTSIGDNCIIHTSTIIGEDALGAVYEDGIPKQGKHFGGVDIGENVELLDRVTIHRGTIDNTVVSPNCIIGSSSILGHNCTVERNVIVCAGVIMCGGVFIGEGAYIGTGSIIRERIRIGERAYVCMGADVVRNVDGESIIRNSSSNVIKKGMANIQRKISGLL